MKESEKTVELLDFLFLHNRLFTEEKSILSKILDNEISSVEEIYHELQSQQYQESIINCNDENLIEKYFKLIHSSDFLECLLTENPSFSSFHKHVVQLLAMNGDCLEQEIFIRKFQEFLGQFSIDLELEMIGNGFCYTLSDSSEESRMLFPFHVGDYKNFANGEMNKKYVLAFQEQSDYPFISCLWYTENNVDFKSYYLINSDDVDLYYYSYSNDYFNTSLELFVSKDDIKLSIDCLMWNLILYKADEECSYRLICKTGDESDIDSNQVFMNSYDLLYENMEGSPIFDMLLECFPFLEEYKPSIYSKN